MFCNNLAIAVRCFQRQAALSLKTFPELLMRAFVVCTFLLLNTPSLLADTGLKTTTGPDLTQVPLLQFEFKDQAASQYQDEVKQLVEQAFQRYVPLFQGHPRDSDGNPYRQLTLKIKTADMPGGEADPGVVELSINPRQIFGYANWRTLLLHEVFHLWNAESFRYASQKEQWFNEGFTDFYAYKTAAQLGVLSPAQALANTALPLGYYQSAAQPFSMRQAAEVSKTDHYFLVYNGGWVTALVLDLDIRKRSQGAHSLDDLMRWMYQHKPRHQQLYQLADILTGLQQSTGLDYQDFFARYIDGKEKIPLAEYLDLGKAAWQLEFHQTPTDASKRLYQSIGIN